MKRNYEEESLTPKPVRVISLIIKAVFVLALVVLLGWLTLRSCYQDGTKKMKQYLWTEKAAEQYENGTFTVNRLSEYNDPDLSRLFYIGNIYHTEEISQLQFMLRYNTESREYKDILDEDGNVEFYFELTDGKGNHYTEYQYITDEALMYRYFRVAFEGIDFSYAETLAVNIYCLADGEETQIGTCVVWEKDGGSAKYKLSGAEKNAEKPNPDIIAAEKSVIVD